MEKVSKAREGADLTDPLSIYRHIWTPHPTRSTLEALYLNSPSAEVPEEIDLLLSLRSKSREA